MDDGAVIRIRRHGRPDACRVILSHGNGCAVDGYFPFWRHLLPDFEVFLFDFRHYGQNPPHEGAHGFARFLLDLTTVYDVIDHDFGEKPQVGIFHSMSARANLRYALEVAWRFAGLILFDPPMVPPPGHPLHDLQLRNERLLWSWSENRQSVFGDPGELARHFASTRMLSGWDPKAYELMARSVLRRDPKTGDWVLCCPGPLESRIYRENATIHLWPDASDLPGPMVLIASDPDSEIPSPPGHSARALRDERGWRYHCVPGTGHFLQIQEPEACLELVRSFMRDIAFDQPGVPTPNTQ